MKKIKRKGIGKGILEEMRLNEEGYEKKDLVMKKKG